MNITVNRIALYGDSIPYFPRLAKYITPELQKCVNKLVEVNYKPLNPCSDKRFESGKFKGTLISASVRTEFNFDGDRGYNTYKLHFKGEPKPFTFFDGDESELILCPDAKGIIESIKPVDIKKDCKQLLALMH